MILMAVCVYVLAPASIGAQQDEGIENVPIPINPKFLDLNGTWNYQTSKPTVSGVCPGGNALAGTAVITQKGNEITLKYTSGAKCKPGAVCFYSGTLEENTISVANSVTVDNEGGTVTSSIVLKAFNNEYIMGQGTNHYVHPKAECRWNMDVTFTREKKEAK